ncbi:probable RNA-binding protein 46 [Folsomia candida]|nr:probable RNA-binding protein 46 [Folsomia candida]
MEWSQQNGQRLYGPPVECNLKLQQGTEVFVSNIPRACTEFHIYSIFENAGPIYQVRMMMDFSGTNRGYCFVRFFEKQHAYKAIHVLNGFEIQKGSKIGVVMSLDNCSLHIPKIPPNKSEEDVRKEIYRVCNDVTNVTVVPHNDGKNNQSCLVDFTTHRAASIARRLFLSRKVKLWDQCCFVEWAQPSDK